MDFFDDEPNDPEGLKRRVHELKRENQRLEGILEETFRAWLADKKVLARYELAQLSASMKEVLDSGKSGPTLSDIIAEFRQQLDQSDGDPPPVT